MTTQRQNPELLEDAHHETTRRQIVRLLSQGELDVWVWQSRSAQRRSVRHLQILKSKTTPKEKTMTQSSATQRSSEQPSDKTSIRPFHVNAPEAELAELRRRIKGTRWPDHETVTDASQGVQLATTQALAPLLGDGVRLAQVRGEDKRRSELHHQH